VIERARRLDCSQDRDRITTLHDWAPDDVRALGPQVHPAGPRAASTLLWTQTSLAENERIQAKHTIMRGT